jgi:hypothetical protein
VYDFASQQVETLERNDMADDISLQDLEDFEKLLQQKTDLLRQADQVLKQELEAVSNFNTKHPHLAEHGHAIADAVKNVETILNSAIHDHNTVVNMVREAKAAAQTYEPKSI